MVPEKALLDPQDHGVDTDVAIVGGGPGGLACAVAIQALYDAKIRVQVPGFLFVSATFLCILMLQAAMLAGVRELSSFQTSRVWGLATSQRAVRLGSYQPRPVCKASTREAYAVAGIWLYVNLVFARAPYHASRTGLKAVITSTCTLSAYPIQLLALEFACALASYLCPFCPLTQACALRVMHRICPSAPYFAVPALTQPGPVPPHRSSHSSSTLSCNAAT